MVAEEEARSWVELQETRAEVEGVLNLEGEGAESETEVVKEAEKDPVEGEPVGPV